LRFCRYQVNETIGYGIVEGDSISVINTDPFSKWTRTGNTVVLARAKLLAPCLPSKVICVGLNYVDHASELSMDVPDEPVIFLKPATAVIGQLEPIIYPKSSHQLDYEAELAMVVKKTAKNISEDAAADYILGYTCANDITARDLQRKDGQWTRAKGFDTFAPIGPWIESKFDPSDVLVESVLNGVVRQSSSTKNMIFGFHKLFEFISGVMTLNPGDVIMTGTPPGVGAMNAGDTIVVRVEGLGLLKNTIGEEK
jgi:2-keto-4-pentenoate hydratase/2-oxohepta-3-ene-1,7-dioic acid hydratase in catechol pathway